jgi:hypothetical protein
VNNLRTILIKLVTFLAGLYFVAEFLAPENVVEGIGLNAVHEPITNGFIAVGTIAFGLGIINLCVTHGTKVLFLRKGVFYSATLLIGLFSMIIISSLEWKNSYASANQATQISLLSDYSSHIARQIKENISEENNQKLKTPGERIVILSQTIDQELYRLNKQIDEQGGHPASRLQIIDLLDKVRECMRSLKSESDKDKIIENLNLSTKELEQLASSFSSWSDSLQKEYSATKLNNFLVNGLFNSLGSAMMSLLALYIAVAAFRAFRIRTLESSLMMLAAVIVILGQTPFGLWISDSMPAIRLWLMEVPNSAAFRAIKIGSAVAGLVLAFRMWFSIESDSFT